MTVYTLTAMRGSNNIFIEPPSTWSSMEKAQDYAFNVLVEENIREEEVVSSSSTLVGNNDVFIICYGYVNTENSFVIVITKNEIDIPPEY